MVSWSQIATDDLKLIYDYIAKDSVVYARRVVEEIINKSECLKVYPNIGRRELIIYSYRMIYQVDNGDVKILALVHSRENFNLETK